MLGDDASPNFNQSTIECKSSSCSVLLQAFLLLTDFLIIWNYTAELDETINCNDYN